MSFGLDGIYPAFLTPLDDEKRFVPETAVRMLHYLLSAGVDGVYVAGTTGEGLKHSTSVRQELVETLGKMFPRDKRLLVHIGSPDIREALVLAEHAAKHGAHAVSSLPPMAPSADVRGYYQELAKQSPLPLILYYFPKIAPHAFQTPQELIEICEFPNVTGVKFTDFNFYLLQQLTARGKFVFNGYDEALAAGLLMGAQGGIGSTYNVMPQVYLEIFRATLRGDWEVARTWQFRANAVLEIMLRYPFFPALRAILKHKGFDCGPLMSGERFASEADSRKLIDELDRSMPEEVANLISW